MMLFSQTRGLPVLTAVEAASLGKVEALSVDATTGTVSYLRLSGAPDHTDAVSWSAVEAVGPDAVIVRSRMAADRTAPDVPAHHEVVGRRVLTDQGSEHGTVKDVAYDPDSGRVLTLFTALGDIPGERLIGAGSYAVVVRAESR
ncbi:PRC-barrel domain-containing protein [Streptomyces sp. NPDC028635]|uniref:PRC-barrel domain-containing protein n=1 Tax=Streptomyces sp. NPDC028635 TaxID=3154800 RepID=UPI003402323B